MKFYRKSFTCIFRIAFLSATLPLPLLTLAQVETTKINNVKIYSEYFPNHNSKFKGTIVFENGSGTPLTEWTKNKEFFHSAKNLGGIFIYDRSCLGKSPPDLSMSIKAPMTASLINMKLMLLLKKRNIRPPYILVAHSYGAMYAGYFARKFPNLVRGVLMVDPVPNNYEWSDLLFKQYNTSIKKINQMRKMSSRELYSKYDMNSTMPAQLFYQLIGFKETKTQINKLNPLSNKIPIIIVSSSYMEKNAPIKGNWYQQQKQWLNTNPHSKIIKVHSGHFIQLDRPKLICKQLKILTEMAVKSSG